MTSPLPALVAVLIGASSFAQVQVTNAHLVPNPAPQPSERFGSVVDIDGDTLAVAAPNAAVGAYLGAVYIYTRTPSGWQLQDTLTPPSPVEPGVFARSLSLDSQNGRIAVGSLEPYSAGGDGSVYLFKRNGTTWNYEDTFVMATDFFGWAVALEGDWLVVDDRSINIVRVYQRQPQGFWSSSPSLHPQSTQYGFGWALGMAGDRLAVGEPGASVFIPQYHWDFPQGEIQIYVRNGTAWQRTASVHSSDYGVCGTSLAFDGDVLAIKSSSGPVNSVDIFRRVTDSYWPFEQRITGVAPASNSGADLALSGQQLLISTSSPVGAVLYEDRGPTAVPRWIPVAQFSEPTMTSVAGQSLALGATSAIIGDANHVSAGVTAGDAFDFGVGAAPRAYCTGKLNSAGCVPSIGWSGLPSVDPATSAQFTITASQVVALKNGIFIYGAAAATTPFFGGTLCVAQPFHRTSLTNSGGTSACSGALTIDFGAYIQSGVDPALTAGVEEFGQWWYRDPAAPLHGGLSNAIAFEIWP